MTNIRNVHPGDRIKMHYGSPVSHDFWNLVGTVVDKNEVHALIDFDEIRKPNGAPYRVNPENFDVFESTPTEAEIRALFNIKRCPTCHRPFEEE